MDTKLRDSYIALRDNIDQMKRSGCTTRIIDLETGEVITGASESLKPDVVSLLTEAKNHLEKPEVVSLCNSRKVVVVYSVNPDGSLEAVSIGTNAGVANNGIATWKKWKKQRGKRTAVAV
jgi:hypothetical protein